MNRQLLFVLAAVLSALLAGCPDDNKNNPAPANSATPAAATGAAPAASSGGAGGTGKGGW